jgi:hypothetical protein
VRKLSIRVAIRGAPRFVSLRRNRGIGRGIGAVGNHLGPHLLDDAILIGVAVLVDDSNYSDWLPPASIEALTVCVP